VQVAKYLELFGLDGKVNIANVELNNAVPALKNKQIDAFVTAGSFPAPNVIEAAASTPVFVLSLSDEQIEQTGATKITIPAGTYKGQETDIVTTSLPVIAYTTTQMSDEVAYELTATFWKERARLGRRLLGGKRFHLTCWPIFPAKSTQVPCATTRKTTSRSPQPTANHTPIGAGHARLAPMLSFLRLAAFGLSHAKTCPA